MARLTSTRFLSLSSLFATTLLAGPLSAPAGAQGLGTNYCTAAPNSTGVGAVMYAGGSQDVDDNNLTLTAGLVPAGQMGIFFYGPNQDMVPFGDGEVVSVGEAAGREAGAKGRL
ncbi:MAG: hypothetical protein QF599_07540 [Planctomycetota bacterium]|jgi:hypothetical protein|nr:hypothetical protein [Planctomycetota bacterium]